MQSEIKKCISIEYGRPLGVTLVSSPHISCVAAPNIKNIKLQTIVYIIGSKMSILYIKKLKTFQTWFRIL